jgi:lysyl-tRNA synthetase class 2
VNLFSFIPGYESAVYQEGKEPLLFLLLAFLVTFALVRLYTRLARTRGWGSASAGGVHLHHMVPGVILMVLAGLVAFTQFGGEEIVFELAAILFGTGAALTLDEFAMILHLKDVYWAKEGRTSVDAMIMGVALAGLFLVTSAPFDANNRHPDDPKAGFFAFLACNVVFAIITFLKKKLILGVLAIFVPPVGWFAAVRLAKPGSPWAHWFYDPERGRATRRAKRQRKLERSRRRFEAGRLGRFEHWFSDLVGGAPTLSAPATEERVLE